MLDVREYLMKFVFYRYKRSKYVSVIIITVGIILCTLASASDVVSCACLNHMCQNVCDFLVYLFSVSVISVCFSVTADRLP